jgi:hypothetical protein
MVEVPATAELLAVSVSRLLPVVGLGLTEAVTPLGIPDGVSVTEPVNPPASFTVIVSVAPAFGETVTLEAEGVSVKLPDVPVLTVSAIVALAVADPDVPVTVSVEVPAGAVLLAISVSALLLVAGLVPKAAVTPFGKPEIASVTFPLKDPTSTMEIVSLLLPPSVSESDVDDGVSEKLPDEPPPLPPQVTPLSANDAGTELVALFHVPVKPTPVTLPPAEMLPL